MRYRVVLKSYASLRRDPVIRCETLLSIPLADGKCSVVERPVRVNDAPTERSRLSGAAGSGWCHLFRWLGFFLPCPCDTRASDGDCDSTSPPA